MAALIHALIQALSQAFGNDALLMIVAILSGVGLLISLLKVLFFLTYGLDLSPGFFWQTMESASRLARAFCCLVAAFGS